MVFADGIDYFHVEPRAGLQGFCSSKDQSWLVSGLMWIAAVMVNGWQMAGGKTHRLVVPSAFVSVLRAEHTIAILCSFMYTLSKHPASQYIHICIYIHIYECISIPPLQHSSTHGVTGHAWSVRLVLQAPSVQLLWELIDDE